MAQSKSSGARTTSGTARKASSTARKGSGTAAKRSGSAQKRSGSANGKSRAKSSSSGGRAKPTSSSPSRTRRPSTNARSADSGITGTIKVVAGKAKRPALAAGAAAAAAAAGILGGVAIKARTQPKKVLGVRVPRSASELDARTIAKAVGKASKQFAETTRGVSKDLDRAAEQAERIGRLLD